MHKASTRHNKRVHHSDYDLHGDIAKIKAALAEATMDAGGRAREVISQSLEDMRERSAAVQENVSTYVTEKPFKTIGASLLAGWLLGFLMRK
jgi:ElaB/YqjD/DUF883 family membrane-anchored ribosome-binding protein